MLGYLTRDYTKGLVYDGTNLNDVLDGQAALKFKKENPDFRTFVIPNLYGVPYEFKFPFYDVTHEDAENDPHRKNITLSRYEKVIELSNLGFISDYTLGAHKALTENYDIYVNSTGGEELYLICQKPIVAIQEEIEEQLQSEDPDIVEEAIRRSSELKQQSMGMDGELIMMKESIMGYTQHDHIVFKPKANSQAQDFQVGQDYDFYFHKYGLRVTVKDNYTAALRYQMLNRALEEWNANPKYKYHQRSTLNQWRQSDVSKRMGRRTVVLAPRRSGKTFLISQEILKEMLAHNYKAGTRPRSVIFLSKDFDAVGQVMDYVNALTNEFDWLKQMMNYDSANHILSLITYDDQGKKRVLAQTKFYSALGKLPAVGDAADAVIIDEALLIPKRIVDKIMPIVDNEGARLLVISTFYSEDEEGVDRIYDWPVKLCNEYEKESSKIIDIDQHIITLRKEKERTGIIPDECAGLRYTIDDVEVIINKDIVKKNLADDPDRYMRELYCRSTESQAVLNFKPYIQPVRFVQDPQPHFVSGVGDAQQIIKPNFKRIVLAYDPAQTADTSAVLATGYDESRNKVIVRKERSLNFKDKSSFIPQAELLKQAIEELKMHNCPILKVMDSTHPAVVDVMWGQRIFFQYLYFWTGGDNVRKGARSSEERVPKKLMVEAAQTMFDNGMVEIWDNDCKQLIEQLGNFVEFKNEYTNKSKYKGATGHDDFVDCLLMCLWTFWTHLGLSHNKFEVDNFTEYAMQQQESKDPRGLLQDTRPQPRYEVVDNAFWY